MTLGERLRITRTAQNMSLRDLEKEIGVINSTLFRVESGKPVVYETGKIIERWLEKVGEPEPCKHCAGKGYKFYQVKL